MNFLLSFKFKNSELTILINFILLQTHYIELLDFLRLHLFLESGIKKIKCKVRKYAWLTLALVKIWN